jgi:hypothetical protein
MNRFDVVVAAYERFNQKDFRGAVAFLHDDAQVDDALLPDTNVVGKDAVERMWRARFGGPATVKVLPGTMYESGHIVVTLVSCHAYAANGTRLGGPAEFLHRLHFREDRISRIEVRAFDTIPGGLRDLFLARSIAEDREWVRHEIEGLIFERSSTPSLSAKEAAYYEALCQRELAAMSYLRACEDAVHLRT